MHNGSQAHDWLKISQLSFSFSRARVFDNLTLTLPTGSPVLAVVGPSGVGKSTLIGLLAGHLTADAGEIRVCGELVDGPSASRPVVFQDHNLFPWKTVLDNVVFGPKCLGVPKPERNDRAWALLKIMRLEESAHMYPKMLSGGMRQRVGLARALAVEPSCILMDEPFNALDHEIKGAVRRDFQKSIVSRSTHAIIVTHDLAEAMMLGSHVLVLRGPGDAASVDLSHLTLPRQEGFQHSAEFKEYIDQISSLLAG